MYKIIGGDGKEYGPVPVEQLQQWLTEGRVNGATRAQLEGTTEWKTLAEYGITGSAPVPPNIPPTVIMRPNVPNYLVQSILVTLCCCMPFGIPAIIFAAQVNGKLTAGDVAGAQEASRKAKLWCWIGFGLGLLGNIIGGLIYGLGAFQQFRNLH